MKPQDILFAGIVVALLFFKKPVSFLVAGLACLSFSIPLFATWTFFTAERLTWYGVFFLCMFLVYQLFIEKGARAR